MANVLSVASGAVRDMEAPAPHGNREGVDDLRRR